MEQTLRSVLRQKDVSVEVLLMDAARDGWVEQTVRTLHDPRLRHLRQTGTFTGRRSELRNMAWPQARGALIHFIDDGDIVPDGHYARVKAAFARLRRAGVVLGRVEGFGDAGEDVRRESRRLADGIASLAQFQGSKVALTSQLLFNPPAYLGGAGIIRKRCLVAVGGYNASLDSLEDVDLYARIIHRFGAHFLDGVALRHPLSQRVPRDTHLSLESSCRAVRDSFRQANGALEFGFLKLVTRSVMAKHLAAAVRGQEAMAQAGPDAASA
jgi:hypothetical protein